jgi:hypothetical protein
MYPWMPLIRRSQCWLTAVGVVAASLTAVTSLADSGSGPPEPIYWRQNLLTVPYQWSSSGAKGTAKSVWLYVSKDRGANWQRVSDAQPQLLAFNYRAEADGEYWFAIRTTDANGHDLVGGTIPGTAAALAPELRVVVDTTMPKIESLSAQPRDAGWLDVRWRVIDANLSAHSCNLEIETDTTGHWQPLPISNATQVSAGVWDASATISLATTPRPLAVRATAIDLAGNRAVFQTSVAGSSVASSAASQSPPDDGPLFSQPASGPAPPPAISEGPGWVSTSAPSAQASGSGPAVPQIWTADRRSAGAFDTSLELKEPVVYGTPLEIDQEQSHAELGAGQELARLPTPELENRPLGNVPTPHDSPWGSNPNFRQVSMSHASLSGEAAAVVANGTDAGSIAVSEPPAPPKNPLAKLVNSRTFAVEYELAGLDQRGVKRVELWGTRDGGHTWRSYAIDDDNRSPVEVTVEGEGEYGFSIVVVAPDDLGSAPPQPGDTPEVYVTVDLQPPLAQILSLNTTRGDVESELTVRWQADDDNLEPRPISIYYSSRPAGPWTTIAANLENVGQYRWPIERHVPRRVYLKLEARDTAGNVTAFQTKEPVVVEQSQAETIWQRLPPVQ